MTFTLWINFHKENTGNSEVGNEEDGQRDETPEINVEEDEGVGAESEQDKPYNMYEYYNC